MTFKEFLVDQVENNEKPVTENKKRAPLVIKKRSNEKKKK